MISVIIPTIPARERYLERVLERYEATTEVAYEVILEYGHDTCSKGWNAGTLKAKGEFIHYSSDDTEPQSGWAEAAIHCVKNGMLPCADLINAAGELTHSGDSGEEHLVVFPEGAPSAIMRMPFYPESLVPALTPVMENHYMSDYWLAWKALQIGWETVVCHGYLFLHHHVQEGRLYTLDADVVDYHRLTGT